MALYDEVSSGIKAKNKKFNNAHIRNLRIMNVTNAVLLIALIVLDLVFMIKNLYTGTTTLTSISLPVFMVAEVIVLVAFIVTHFSRASMVTKVVLTVTFSLPIIPYISAITLGVPAAGILIVTRLIGITALAMLLYNTKSTQDRKVFAVKGVPLYIASIVAIVGLVGLFTIGNNRKVIYTYSNDEKGYIVTEVLDGYGDVVLRDDTVGISADSLKNVKGTLDIPASVRYINENAFNESEIDKLIVNSNDIKITESLNKSNIDKVYLFSSDTKLDIDSNTCINTRFYTPKSDVDSYRSKYFDHDFLFVPIVEDGEMYVCYDGTGLPVEYYKMGTVIDEPIVEPKEGEQEIIFTGWYENGNKIEFPYAVKKNSQIKATYNNVYTITYDTDDVNYEGDLTNKYYEDLGKIELPTLEKTDHRFMGWYEVDNNGKYLEKYNELNNTVTRNIKLKAKFLEIFDLSYDSTIGVMPEEYETEFIVEDTFSLPIPSKFGYDFDGWYLNDNKIETLNDLEGDSSLVARWKFVEPTVSYLNDINSVNKDYDNNSETITILASHILGDGVSISYLWNKVGDTTTLSETSSLSFKNASQSGTYNCRIRVYDGITERIKDEQVTVNINKIDYDMSSYSFVDSSFVYDGFEQKPTTEGSLPIGLDGLSPNPVFSEGLKNVGNKDVILSFTVESENYNVPQSLKAKVTVTPKPITVVWGETTLTFTGKAIHPEVKKFNGVITGDVINPEYTGAKNSVGKDYVVEITSLGNPNYIINETKTITFEIVKKSGSLSIVVPEFTEVTYNGEIQYPSYEGNVPNYVSVTYSITSAKDAGEYNMTITFEGENNEQTIKEVYQTKLIIKPIVISVSYSENTFIYNEKRQAPTFDVVNKIGSDIININAKTPNSIIVGSYQLELLSIDNPNYTLPEVVTFDYVINKADYNMDGIRFENSSYEFTYNGLSQHPNLSGKLPDGLSVSYSANAINAGTYTVEATFTSINSNYNVPSSITVTVKINPIKTTVEWGTTTLDFIKDTPQAPKATIKDKLPGDVVYVSVSGEKINAGDYTATAENIVDADGNISANYVLIGEKTISFTIVSKNGNYEIIFEDETFIYDGMEHHPDVEISFGDDEPHFFTVKEYSATITNVGAVQITVSFMYADGFESSGYTLPSDRTATAYVVPVEAQILWTNQTFVYDGTSKLPGATVTNAIGSDIVTVELDSTGNINAGSYTVRAVRLSNQNYVLPELTQQLICDYKINKAKYDTSSIVFDPITVTYDGKPHRPEVIHDILGEDGFDIVVTYSTQVTNVCTLQAVVASFKGSDNYEAITSRTSYVTITPKEVSLNWTDLTFTYDGTVKKPSCTPVGVVLGDSCIVTVKASGKNAGTYTAEAVALSNSNYSISSLTKTQDYVISKANLVLDVEFNDVTVTYDKQLHYPELVGDLPYGVTAKYSQGFMDVGMHTVTVSFEVNENYNEVDDMSATVTINPREVSISWSNTTVPYTGVQVYPTYILAGVISGDECDVVITGLGINAGTYTVTATKTTNNNYALNDTSKTDYVIKKADYDMSAIKFDDVSFVYDGKSHTASISNLPVGADGVALKAKLSGSATNVSDDGTVIATFSTESENYNVPDSRSVIVTITPKEISLVWSNLVFTYDNESHRPDVYVEGLYEGDICTVTVIGGAVDAGSHEASISSISNPNYKLPVDSTKSFKINKAVYDMTGVTFEDAVLTYNGTNQSYEVSGLENVIGLDGSTPIASYNKTIKDVSEGTVTFTVTFVSDSSNYESPTKMTCNVKVVPVVVNVDITLDSVPSTGLSTEGANNKLAYKYDGREHSIVVSVESGLIGSDLCNFTASGTVKNQTNNTYQEFEIKSDNENYVPNYQTVSIKVTPFQMWWYKWTDDDHISDGTFNFGDEFNDDFEKVYCVKGTQIELGYNPITERIPGEYSIYMKAKTENVSIEQNFKSLRTIAVYGTVEDVIRLIDSVDVETLSEENAYIVKAARFGYNNLSVSDKAKVTNYSKLIELEGMVYDPFTVTFDGGKGYATNGQTITNTGNMQSNAPQKTYNDVVYTKALKIESSTTISFEISSDMTIILVTTLAKDKSIKVNGTSYKANEDGIVTVNAEAGSITITKGDTANLYAIIVK